MYYNAPPPASSPGLQHKMSNPHDQSIWSRAHHPVLSNPAATATQPQGPQSPGYSGSPTSSGQIIGNHHWQTQLLKADLCRQSNSPHHRARASAMATRNSAKSAIPITNPNAKLPPPESISNGTSNTDSPKSDKTGSPSELISSPERTGGHPSSTAAPIAPVKKQESTWTTLDLGGIRLKNLSPGLFRFSYLTTLYLNHNSLTSLPSEISLLRNLVLLDLSGNDLSAVPPELGMLTSLRELYLFDNHITNLPHELGSLHQLEMIGIEGNPMDNALRNIVQKDGTHALISYLRDSCPVPSPPPERLWRFLQTEAERKAQDADPTTEAFTLLSYNILCERAATSHLYGYTPSWALSWDYRKELILTEVMNYDADFLCLQEVDVAQYEDYFLQHLAAQDYEGVYWPKSRARTMGDAERRRVDGCATFYKASKYQLVEKQLIEFNQVALQRPDFKKTDDMFNRVLTKDQIAVVMLLESRATGSRLIIANVHIHWDPEYRDVKLVQTALLMDELQKISDRFARLPPRLPAHMEDPSKPPQPTYADGSKIPTIVCGDFNSIPGSGVYDFLANGTVPSDHPDFMSHVYGHYTSDGLKHRLNLKSAYAAVGELPLTNYTPSFQGVIDYIWHTAGNLTVTSLLGEVEAGYLSKVVGFPNAHFPSDHICLISEFRVKQLKDTQAGAPRPPLVFPSSNGAKPH
ncbi:Endonuclease/exonuclease/phosphatase [Hysterangium stoloniferum]|nr:Endonuclease/exonuclease/phosphatase [Hysterangium stoloniferum]